MNKQLRYTTHMLAIILMAGNMQSLGANIFWCSNESDEKIEVKVEYVQKNFKDSNQTVTLIIAPGAKNIEFRPETVASFYNEHYWIDNQGKVIKINLSGATFEEKYIFHNALDDFVNPDGLDMKLFYKGNGSFQLVLISLSYKVINES